MTALLGIDIGTSGTKTVLFDEKGKPVASHTAEYALYQPHNGWAEQNPEEWWQATVEGIRAVLATSGIAPGHIAGIGLSGQMHGLVMLDNGGQVLRPAIIWCDQRTEAACEKMDAILGRDTIIQITGNPAMTGFTASKIVWMQQNEPEIYARCVHILLPKDYIRYRLTGEFATEVSDASGMQLMDVAKRDWSGKVLSALQVDRSLLPSMHESPDITGRVHNAAARATGLATGTPVAGGAGDNPAAAIGTGVVRQGSAFTTIGSSAVVYAVSDALHIDPKGRIHSLCASVPGKWTVMSCTQAAGLSLKWLRDTVCTEEMTKAALQNIDPYVIMDRLAEALPIGAEKLLFLPYLMGERSPHPDPHCRGVFFGLSGIHTRAHLIRAVLEGVAYSQLECVEIFREMGVPVKDMTVTGGGGRSKIWRQMLADLYGCGIKTLVNDEGAALGAALLAGVGVGIFGSVEEASDAIVQKKKPILPNQVNHTAYMPYFSLYKKLYADLKQDFSLLSRL